MVFRDFSHPCGLLQEEVEVVITKNFGWHSDLGGGSFLTKVGWNNNPTWVGLRPVLILNTSFFGVIPTKNTRHNHLDFLL